MRKSGISWRKSHSFYTIGEAFAFCEPMKKETAFWAEQVQHGAQVLLGGNSTTGVFYETTWPMANSQWRLPSSQPLQAQFLIANGGFQATSLWRLNEFPLAHGGFKLPPFAHLPPAFGASITFQPMLFLAAAETSSGQCMAHNPRGFFWSLNRSMFHPLCVHVVRHAKHLWQL